MPDPSDGVAKHDVGGTLSNGVAAQQAIAAVAEGVGGSEALALRLALGIDMLDAQQNRETLERVEDMPMTVLSDRLSSASKAAIICLTAETKAAPTPNR